MNMGAALSAPSHPTATPPTHNIAVTNMQQAIYTANNGAQLLIDLSSVPLDNFVQAALTSGPVSLKRTAAGKGVELCKYIYSYLSAVPTGGAYTAYHNARELKYTGVPPQANLDVFCAIGAEALCRERAFLLHIALAEAKVSSRICFGDKPGAGHAWVEYPAVGTVTHLWDPTQNLRLIDPGLISAQRGSYPSNQQSVVLVNPIVTIP